MDITDKTTIGELIDYIDENYNLLTISNKDYGWEGPYVICYLEHNNQMRELKIYLHKYIVDNLMKRDSFIEAESS